MGQFSILQKLIEIDSPSGYTHKAAEYIHDLLSRYGWLPEYTNKGAVRCSLGPNPSLAIAAHIDTLGAIVSGIKSDGTLKFSTLGGLALNTAEGEYVRIHTLEDHVYTGTILLNNPSVHANKGSSSQKRSISNMHIRIDEEVTTREEVRQLGIRNGDIIAVEPRYQELSNGYIKSKFLDNKGGCYVLLELARRIKQSEGEVPVELFFSNYEEVGHGGTCGYSDTITKLLVIDMGVVGNDCEGHERACSICAKDSSGPYDYEFRRDLVQLAEEKEIPHKVDIYPYYGSDGSAALRAGNDFRVALIGPGVAASHGMERTHAKGIEATIELCLAYIYNR